MTRHILIVEDEKKIARIHADYLRDSHYSSSCIEDGSLVIEWVKENEPDLILLDLMLPGRDGISLCREIRTFSQVPIIMITARIEEIDRVLGLEIGANDYICKPFSPREVIARINALFRMIDTFQAGTTASDTAANESGLYIDSSRFEARYEGALLTLTPVEFKLLACLSNPPYQVYSRLQLVHRAHDDYRVITERTIDTHIKNLRKKLQQAGMKADVIESVYGIGYKWKYTGAQ